MFQATNQFLLFTLAWNQPYNSSNRIDPNRYCGTDIPPRIEARMQLPALDGGIINFWFQQHTVQDHGKSTLKHRKL